MTRKQLVSGLRALHESDVITNIKLNSKRKAVVIEYYTTMIPEIKGLNAKRYGQLIITYAT